MESALDILSNLALFQTSHLIQNSNNNNNNDIPIDPSLLEEDDGENTEEDEEMITITTTNNNNNNNNINPSTSSTSIPTSLPHFNSFLPPIDYSNSNSITNIISSNSNSNSNPNSNSTPLTFQSYFQSPTPPVLLNFPSLNHHSNLNRNLTTFNSTSFVNNLPPLPSFTSNSLPSLPVIINSPPPPPPAPPAPSIQNNKNNINQNKNKNNNNNNTSTSSASSSVTTFFNSNSIPHRVPEDSGIIRCICSDTSDDGFTIQCDHCNVWQHANCVGISQEDVPEEYSCEICDPKGARIRLLESRLREQEAKNMSLTNAAAAGGNDSLNSRSNAGGNQDSSSGNSNLTPATSGKGKGRKSFEEGGIGSSNFESPSTPSGSTTVADGTPRDALGRKKRGRVPGGGSRRNTNTTMNGISPVATSTSTPTTFNSTSLNSSNNNNINNEIITSTEPVVGRLSSLGSLRGTVAAANAANAAAAAALAASNAALSEEEDTVDDYESWRFEFTPIDRNLYKDLNLVEKLNCLLKDKDQLKEWELQSDLSSLGGGGKDTNTILASLGVTAPLLLEKLPSSASIVVTPLPATALYLPPAQPTSNSTNPNYSNNNSNSTSAQQSALYSYSRPNIYTLTAESLISSGTFILPIKGTITSLDKYRLDPLNQYSILGVPKHGVRSLPHPWSLAIDSRMLGNEARFIRSGCHPNAIIRVIKIIPSTASSVDEMELVGEGESNWSDQTKGNQLNSELIFAIYATRDISKREEIILPWEWDDNHLVHLLPNLLNSPPSPSSTFSKDSLLIQQDLPILIKKFLEVVTTLLGSSSHCACENKLNCVIYWLFKIGNILNPTSTITNSLSSAENRRGPPIKREPLTTLFMNALEVGKEKGTGSNGTVGVGGGGQRGKPRKVKKPDVGFLLGVEREWIRRPVIPVEVTKEEDLVSVEMEVEEQVVAMEVEEVELVDQMENEIEIKLPQSTKSKSKSKSSSIVPSPSIKSNLSLPSLKKSSVTTSITPPTPKRSLPPPIIDPLDSDDSDLTEPLPHQSSSDSSSSSDLDSSLSEAEVEQEEEEEEEEPIIRPPPKRKFNSSTPIPSTSKLSNNNSSNSNSKNSHNSSPMRRSLSSSKTIGPNRNNKRDREIEPVLVKRKKLISSKEKEKEKEKLRPEIVEKIKIKSKDGEKEKGKGKDKEMERSEKSEKDKVSKDTDKEKQKDRVDRKTEKVVEVKKKPPKIVLVEDETESIQLDDKKSSLVDKITTSLPSTSLTSSNSIKPTTININPLDSMDTSADSPIVVVSNALDITSLPPPPLPVVVEPEPEPIPEPVKVVPRPRLSLAEYRQRQALRQPSPTSSLPLPSPAISVSSVGETTENKAIPVTSTSESISKPDYFNQSSLYSTSLMNSNPFSTPNSMTSFVAPLPTPPIQPVRTTEELLKGIKEYFARPAVAKATVVESRPLVRSPSPVEKVITIPVPTLAPTPASKEEKLLPSPMSYERVPEVVAPARAYGRQASIHTGSSSSSLPISTFSGSSNSIIPARAPLPTFTSKIPTFRASSPPLQVTPSTPVVSSKATYPARSPNQPVVQPKRVASPPYQRRPSPPVRPSTLEVPTASAPPSAPRGMTSPNLGPTITSAGSSSINRNTNQPPNRLHTSPPSYRNNGESNRGGPIRNSYNNNNLGNRRYQSTMEHTEESSMAAFLGPPPSGPRSFSQSSTSTSSTGNPSTTNSNSSSSTSRGSWPTTAASGSYSSRGGSSYPRGGGYFGIPAGPRGGGSSRGMLPRGGGSGRGSQQSGHGYGRGRGGDRGSSSRE